VTPTGISGVDNGNIPFVSAGEWLIEYTSHHAANRKAFQSLPRALSEPVSSSPPDTEIVQL
jgi:hypothetical protein